MKISLEEVNFLGLYFTYRHIILQPYTAGKKVRIPWWVVKQKANSSIVENHQLWIGPHLDYHKANKSYLKALEKDINFATIGISNQSCERINKEV